MVFKHVNTANQSNFHNFVATGSRAATSKTIASCLCSKMAVDDCFPCFYCIALMKRGCNTFLRGKFAKTVWIFLETPHCGVGIQAMMIPLMTLGNKSSFHLFSHPSKNHILV